MTRWLKQLEAGQPCLQQLQRRGKGGLFCPWAKATAEFSSPLSSTCPACSQPLPPVWGGIPSPKAKGASRVQTLPLPTPDLDAEQRHRSAAAAAAAPPRAGGSSQPTVVQAGALQAGGFLGLTTRSRLPPKSSFTKHQRPRGLPLRQVNRTRVMEHLLPTLAKHKR